MMEGLYLLSPDRSNVDFTIPFAFEETNGRDPWFTKTSYALTEPPAPFPQAT